MANRNMSDARVKQVADLARKDGIDDAAKQLGITRETVRRMIREHKQRKRGKASDRELATRQQLADAILDKFSSAEMKAILGERKPVKATRPIHNFLGRELKFVAMTDTHLGSIYTNPDFVYEVFECAEKEKADFITHSGDLSEGFSGREGHVYECSHFGYKAQRDHCVDVVSEAPTEMYGISGNHDRWFLKKVGAHIVADVAALVPKFHFLGDDEGDIRLGPNATLRLWHGEDTSSYATSYRIQKLVEAFTGGDKPNILVCGHTHKWGHFFPRHVHAVSVGAIQKQSRWMRSKRLASETGFAVITVTLNKRGVADFDAKWKPFYV